MANVSFKRGLYSNLFKTDAKYEDGCFYLTTDTNRLYIGKTVQNEAGQSETKCVPVNQGVIIADKLSDITSATNIDKTPGLFYYAKAENILCTYNGTQWVQINPDTNTDRDTKVTAIETTVTENADTDIVTIEHTLSNTTYDIDGAQVGQVDKSLKISENIEGGTGIDVGVNGNNVVVNFNDTFEVKLDKKTENDVEKVVSATIGLKESGASFKIKKNDDIDLAVSGSELEIKTKGPKSVFYKYDTNNGLKVELRDEEGATIAAPANQPNVELYYTLGDDATTKYPVNTSLPVYTKTQVDELVENLNGLVYTGTLGSVTDIQNLMADGNKKNLDVGQMYMVSASISITDAIKPYFVFDGTPTTDGSLEQGDLLICVANGTDSYKLTIVPSGDNAATDTNYKLQFTSSTPSFALRSLVGAQHVDKETVEFTTEQDSVLTVAGKTTADDATKPEVLTDLKVEINHKKVTPVHTNSTATEYATQAITSIAFDKYGHVASYTTEAIGNHTLSGAKTAQKNEFVISLKSADGAAAGSATIDSSSLTLTSVTNSNKVSIDMVWGSF